MQLAAVADLADKPADIGVHAAADVDEQPAVGRHRALLAEQVAECGDAGLLGMPALRDLRQLLGIAEQHRLVADVPTARASASDTWPASSISSVSTTPSSPGRANSQDVPANSSTSSRRCFAIVVTDVLDRTRLPER